MFQEGTIQGGISVPLPLTEDMYEDELLPYDLLNGLNISEG